MRSVHPERSSVSAPARSSRVLDVVLSEGYQHGSRYAADLAEIIGYAELLALGLALGLLPFQIISRSRLDLLGRVLVETLDMRDLARIHVRHLLNRLEAFGGEQLGDHLVDVESLHEALRAFAKFLLASLGLFLLRQDVDIPTGKLGGQSHILTAAANSERELALGDHDLDAVGSLHRARPW